MARTLAILKVALVVALVVSMVGVVFAQDEAEDTGEKKKKKNRGARKGAIGGAVAGLALGALTGDAELAVKGAAAGAVVGGVSGSWYDYDQDRQDDRTQMMADAIATRPAGGGAPAAAAPEVSKGETVGDVGRRQLEALHGEWKIDIWALGADGKRIPATGMARGLAAGESGTRILYRDIKAEGYDLVLEGYSLFTYDPGQGFFFENSFSGSEEVVKGVGEYLVDRNAYDYYLLAGEGGEMVSGGHLRSNLRVEIRIAGPALWFAETYTHIDGEEVQVQSYRFTRP